MTFYTHFILGGGFCCKSEVLYLSCEYGVNYQRRKQLPHRLIDGKFPVTNMKPNGICSKMMESLIR
jgi:hypothetical protein